MNQGSSKEVVDRFIANYIDSVPHLEALLLLWHSRPKQWLPDEIAKRLFIGSDHARNILQDLCRQDLAVSSRDQAGPESYEFKTGESDALVESVDVAYRQELVRISTMIHTKASAAVREFARAFRITKERE
jgi:predicted ArsR family transcriptional regulator